MKTKRIHSAWTTGGSIFIRKSNNPASKATKISSVENLKAVNFLILCCKYLQMDEVECCTSSISSTLDIGYRGSSIFWTSDVVILLHQVHFDIGCSGSSMSSSFGG